MLKSIPRLVWLAAIVLTLDLWCVSLVWHPGPEWILVFELATLAGAVGGFEALHWMARSSPWAVPPSGDLPERLDFRGRLAEVPWRDAAWMRSALLRLLSGSGLVLFPLSLFYLLQPILTLPHFLASPLFAQLNRLEGPGLAAAVTAPLLLWGPRLPAGGRERLHAAMACGLALLSLTVLCLADGHPPLYYLMRTDVLEGLMNLTYHVYSLMVGGLVWWGVSRVSR